MCQSCSFSAPKFVQQAELSPIPRFRCTFNRCVGSPHRAQFIGLSHYVTLTYYYARYDNFQCRRAAVSCVTGFAENWLRDIKVSLLSVSGDERIIVFSITGRRAALNTTVQSQVRCKKQSVSDAADWRTGAFHSSRVRTSDPAHHPIIARWAALRPFSGHPGLSAAQMSCCFCWWW